MKTLAAYRLEIACALIVALMCGLPSIIMRQVLAREGKAYAPLVLDGVTGLTYDEATYYAPGCRAALDGRLLTGDPETYEYRNNPPRLGGGVLCYWVGAKLARLAGNSVPSGFDLSRFILPALCFLLTALACRQIGAPRWIAVAASLLAIVAHDQLTLILKLLGNRHGISVIDHLHLLRSQRPIEYVRFPNPSFSWLPCLGAIMSVHALVTTGQRWYAALLAVLVAALAYSYVFFFTFVLMAAGLYALWEGMTGRGRAAAWVLLGLLAGCVLGAPVLAQMMSPANYGLEAVTQRLAWGGAEISPAKQKYEIALWLLFLALYPKRRPEFPYLATVAIAPYACIIAARLAGMNVQDWHWVGRCWYIWMCLCLVMMVWAIGETQYRHRKLAAIAGLVKRATTPFAVVLSVLILAYGLNDHARFGSQMADRYVLSPGQYAAFAWLNEHTSADDVVMSVSCDTSGLVPIYTHCKVYRPYALCTPASDEEQAMRFWVTNSLLRVKSEAIDKMLQPREHVEGRTDGLAWWNIEWLYHTEAGSRTLPADVASTFDALRNQMRSWDPAEIVHFRKVDFVWFGQMEREVCALDPDTTPWLRKEFAQDGVALYRVMPELMVNPDANARYLEAPFADVNPPRSRNTKVRRVPRRR